MVRGYELLRVGYYNPEVSERVKRVLKVTMKNDYVYRLALQDDDAYAAYETGIATLTKELEAIVGVKRLEEMGIDLVVWGRKRLQRKENNKRHMDRNATPARDGAMEDPIDKRAGGRAPKVKQVTVTKRIVMDDAGPSQRATQPTPAKKRARKSKTINVTQ